MARRASQIVDRGLGVVLDEGVPSSRNGGGKPQIQEKNPEGVKGAAQRTKNRRMREAYNAYMREYMRKRRGKL